MRGIPEQQHLAVDVPRHGVHRAELTLRVGRELRGEIRQQRQGIGELAGEELLHRLWRGERREAQRPLAREEQRRREAAVGIRQRDQHEAPPRPDVQRVPLEGATRRRRDRELLVVVVEPVLTHPHEVRRAKAGADRGARPVGRDRGRERQLIVTAADSVAQAQAPLAGVGAQTLLVEVHADVAVPRRRFDQHAVELGSPHREDDLVLALAVGLERNGAATIVDHAPAHRYQQRPHALEHPGTLERAYAARGEREVDGAAALGSCLARVRAALVERYRDPAPRQRQRQQRAGEARAHDVDVRPRGQPHGLACSVSLSARAKRHASSKRL